MGTARYVYGKNSVKAVLDSSPEKVFKIFLAEGLKPDKRLQHIQEISRERKIPTQIVPRMRLDQLLRNEQDIRIQKERESGKAQSVSPDRTRSHQDEDERTAPVHQGIVASVAPKALLDVPALIKVCKSRIEAGEFPRLLLLDSVTDPRNFGAILRVADAAGIDGVIIPRHHSAGFGPAVSKTASGAEESVPIAVSGNLNQAIRGLKEAGFWIAGAAHDPKAVAYYKQDYQMPIALIMGSEDKGLGNLIRQNCDFLLSIPMMGTVESLNVATATAVLLFEMAKPKTSPKPKKAD